MKPTIKQLDDLKAKIVEARLALDLTYSEIGKISNVHPSQVSRICNGHFKTFSHSVMQICKVLHINVPSLEAKQSDMAPEWAQAMSSMRKIWDETPEGAQLISRILDAIADLKVRTD